MAAAKALPGLEREQVLNPDGHTIRIIDTWRFFVGNAEILPFNFVQDFAFKCQEKPTSWSLRLEFHRLPTNSSVTCEITIKRLDNAPVDMGTDFWMRPILPFPFPDLSTRNLRAEDMFPNRQGRSFIQFLPNEALMKLGNLPLRLEIFFRIRHCHGDLESRSLSADYQEPFPPPTASEYMRVSNHSRDR